MRMTSRVSRCIAMTAMVSLAALVVGLRPVAAKESAQTDCLIQLENADGEDVGSTIECTDCDPSCDADADNSTPNGQCTIRLRATLNIPTATCQAQSLKKAKVNPKKARISITPNGASSVMGAFTDLVLRLKGKKSKQKKMTLKAMAQTDTKPKAKDVDKVKVVCKRQTGTCPPPTSTTTTTTSTSTTSTTLGCGDGTIDPSNGEQCDPAAVPIGCGAGEGCIPCGPDRCTCAAGCSEPSGGDPTMLNFTTGTNVSAGCGDPGLPEGADGQAPTTGTVTVTNLMTMGTSIRNLGAGCLYVGGGASTVPGGLTPDTSTSKLDIALVCASNQLQVCGHSDAADVNDRLSCTKAAGPGRSCINKLENYPASPLIACTSDADCDGIPGACVETPNCFFGPPLPISNAGTSTCVLNTFGAEGNGTINSATGQAQLVLPLRSHTFVTGNPFEPCPKCVGGMCNAGQRAGMACTPVGTQLVSLDCPPGGVYLPEFEVTLDPLATGTVSRADPAGLFCPGQGNNPGEAAPGAFGTNTLGGPMGTDLVEVATAIEQMGSPGGSLIDMMPHDSTLASVFCIPATGNGLIDGAASLPGPGSVSLPGQVQLQ